MEDGRIIELFFARSQKALTELDLSYGRLCRSLAEGVLGDSRDAEECVNDAYLALWNSIPPQRPKSLLAYLCKTVRNISLAALKKHTALKRDSRRNVAIDELEGVLVSKSDPMGEVEAKELAFEIENFLKSLSKKDRVVFMQRYAFFMSYEDISQASGLSAKNVSVRLSRIRTRLRRCLEERGLV